jgi:hypothetical protein
MKKMTTQGVLMLAVVALISLAPSVEAQGIRWAGAVSPNSSGRESILHAPDDSFTAVDPPLLVNAFGATMRYAGLARLLGVSDASLARADVIGFEGNGGHGAGVDRGWESSIWTFSDGMNVRRVSFNELVGASPHPGSDPAVIGTGSITGAAYSSFFGMCSADPKNPVVSYILISLRSGRPVINSASPSFSIKLENGVRPDRSFGEGTPDPDAIGIFSACPAK